MYLMRLQYLRCVGLQSDCNLSLLFYDRKREEEKQQRNRKKKKSPTKKLTNYYFFFPKKKFESVCLAFVAAWFSGFRGRGRAAALPG